MKQVIEETQEICLMCGGRGTEYSHQNTSGIATCRGCQGNRYIVTKRLVRYEIEGAALPAPEQESKS